MQAHGLLSGFLVSGSRGLKQADAERIKPFQLVALKRYQPQFLAGWLCEEYSVAKEAALETCQREFFAREKHAIDEHLPGDTHSDLQLHTDFSQVSSDLILLPVYLLSYRYGERLFQFLVNGQTGKVAGDKPLSSWRIGLAATVVGILLAVLVFLFLLSQR